MKRKNFIIPVFLVINFLAGQEYFETLPENPDPSKCFAKCVVPDEYEEEVVKIMTRSEYEKLEIVPAVYETKLEEIIIRPESKRFTYVPAVYETVLDTLWLKDDYHKLTVHPAEFNTDFESIEIMPLTSKWVAGEKDPDCPSIDPADCRIFHYVEQPAIMRDVPVQKLKIAEKTSAETIKGNYRLITKQVEVSPAKAIEEIIPAKTKSVERQVLISDETTVVKKIPAEYTEIIKKRLLKKRRYDSMARSSL